MMEQSFIRLLMNVSDDMNAEERVFNMAFHAIKAEMKKEKPEGTYGIQNEGKDDGECRE